MPHEDKIRHHDVRGFLPLGLFVLLLGLAVFGWGLHYKLSLYQVDAQASSTSPSAKLLSERERPSDKSVQTDREAPQAPALALSAFIVFLPRPASPAKRTSETSPRPPRLIALKSPSFLRPPPLLA